MRRSSVLVSVFALFLLLGCAHAPGGFLAKRTQDTYDIFVGGAVEAKEDSFYAGAYLTCLENHKTGFEVKSRISDVYGSIDATIQCKGIPDPFLATKFSGTELMLEESGVRYAGGLKYTLVSPDVDPGVAERKAAWGITD